MPSNKEQMFVPLIPLLRELSDRLEIFHMETEEKTQLIAAYHQIRTDTLLGKRYTPSSDAPGRGQSIPQIPRVLDKPPFERRDSA